MREFFKKIEPYVFYLFIFTIPFEKRLIVHRWTHSFNEWMSAYVYGTDILIFILFAFWAARAFNFKNKISPSLKNPNMWLTGFFVVSAISVFNSKITGLSFYQLLKLGEFIVLYFYLKNNFNGIFGFRKTLAVIIVSGFFQAAIGISQFLKQSSLGLRLFGESPLLPNASGVAVFIVGAQKYLRAYGTMPHPNVLAVWLFLAVFAFYNFYLYSPKIKNNFCLLGYPVLLFGLFFTFSRVIVGLWGFGVAIRFIAVFFKKSFKEFLRLAKKRLIKLLLATAATSLLFVILYWPLVLSRLHISAEDEAVTQRVFYNQIAESIVATHPWFGIGIGQFVPNMITKLKYLPTSFYQPAHNVYLLIAGETGFIGLTIFILFLFFVFYNFIKKTGLKRLDHFSFFILALSFLAMGLFDHFLWTLQQGSLVFWMVLALISAPVGQLV